MNSYRDVNPGEEWQPEPAARYNGVNDMLRRFDALGAGNPVAVPALRGAAVVKAVYTGGSSLPAYSLLAISGAATVLTSGGSVTVNPRDVADTVFVATSAADEGSPLYGVATSPVTVGATVGVVLAGITPVRVASGGICSGGEMLAPTSGGVATLGGGKIQALGGTVSAGSGGYIAPALLGGGGAITLAAVVTPPTSGGNIGTVAPVVVGSGGAITPTSGASIPVVFPFLDGYN